MLEHNTTPNNCPLSFSICPSASGQTAPASTLGASWTPRGHNQPPASSGSCASQPTTARRHGGLTGCMPAVPAGRLLMWSPPPCQQQTTALQQVSHSRRQGRCAPRAHPNGAADRRCSALQAPIARQRPRWRQPLRASQQPPKTPPCSCSQTAFTRGRHGSPRLACARWPGGWRPGRDAIPWPERRARGLEAGRGSGGKESSQPGGAVRRVGGGRRRL
jgi:hypothetical protein